MRLLDAIVLALCFGLQGSARYPGLVVDQEIRKDHTGLNIP